MVNYAYQLDPNKFPVSSTTVISTTSTTTDTAGKSIPNTSNYTAQYDLNTRAKYFTENPGRVPLSKDVYDLLFKSKIV